MEEKCKMSEVSVKKETNGAGPIILDGKFFVIKSIENGIVSAECQTCKKLVRGRFDSTSNYFNHLKTKKHNVEDYILYKNQTFVHHTKRSADGSSSKKRRRISIEDQANNIRKSYSIPLILDGQFFKITSILDGTVSAECQKCKKVLKGSFDSTSNFRNHLRTKTHSYKEYEIYMSSPKEYKKNKCFSSNKALQKSLIKQEKAETFMKSLSMTPVKSKFKKQEANDLITTFIINTMSPMALVENEDFINLIKGVNNLKSHVEIMTSTALAADIDNRYNKVVTGLKEKLKVTKFVCTTADLWSNQKRNYLGVTVHWINENFERESAALAFRRLRGSHTCERLAGMINEIHAEFTNISTTTIVKTITDNGSNMAKAPVIKEFKIERASSTIQEQESLNLLLSDQNLAGVLEICYDSEEEEEEDNTDDDMLMIPITDKLLNPEPETSDDIFTDVYLSEYQQCISHTLNLMTTVDISKGLSENPNYVYSKIHHSALRKCKGIWNLTSRSPRACEMYQNITNKCPFSPCSNEWSSIFDCIEKLLSIKEKLNEVCQTLCLPIFKEREIYFLQEYLEVLQPFSEAINNLQESKHAFFGEFMPQLIRIKKIVELFKFKQLTYCSKIASILLQSLESRFKDYFQFSPEANDAILAAVTHPFFKIRWAPREQKPHLKKLLLSALECLSEKTNKSKLNDKYFLFEDEGSDSETSESGNKNSLELQAIKYLQNDSTDLSILNQFPAIKYLFIKYNTPLSSSARVKQLFPFSDMILRSKRRNMSDSNFEKFLIIKANM